MDKDTPDASVMENVPNEQIYSSSMENQEFGMARSAERAKMMGQGGDVAYLGVFDDAMANYSYGKPQEQQRIDMLGLLTGDENAYLNGTFKAFLKRPELFQETGENLLYAMFVGRQYKKEALYTMFKGFMHKNPETPESQLLFLWAEELRKYKKFTEFEPVFAKLNNVIDLWFAKKTIKFNGETTPLVSFRPILYNSAGVNLVELLPYIAYVYTYLIYGFPYTFSDSYSQSSLRSYYDGLEAWFAKCYSDLYQQHGISSTTYNSNSAHDISDKNWKAFYERMLRSDEIVRLRNEEIEKTSGILNAFISQQQSLSDEELNKKYELVLVKLIECAIDETSYKGIYALFPTFDAAYENTTEIMQLTQFFLTQNQRNFAIDPHNNYRYYFYNDSLDGYGARFKLVRPNLKIKHYGNKDNMPFAYGDFKIQMLSAYILERFKTKRGFQLDDNGIYLSPSDLNIRGLREFIMAFFVNGLWALSNSSISPAMSYLQKSSRTAQYIDDLVQALDLFRIIHGNNVASILTPIYAISMLDEWLERHLSLGGQLDDFNPYMYLNLSIPNNDRANKLTAILYSMLFLNNKEYVNMVNVCIEEFEDIMSHRPIIVQPYVKVLNDQTSIYAIGGVDTYRYAKFSNPVLRSYGFIANVLGLNEKIYVLYRFTENLQNDTVFQLVEANAHEPSVVINTLMQACKSEGNLPSLLFRWKIGSDGLVEERVINDIIGTRIGDDESKYVLSWMLNFMFKQGIAGETIPTETLYNKVISLSTFGNLESKQQATPNGYMIDKHVILSRLDAAGVPAKLPIYTPAPNIFARNVSFVCPQGKRQIQFVAPSSTVIEENMVFWVFTDVPFKNSFARTSDVQYDLRSSGMKPLDGTYMLTDRIQGFPK